MTTKYYTSEGENSTNINPMHIDQSNQSSQSSKYNGTTINPKYTKRMEKQDIVINIIDKKINTLSGNAAETNKKIIDTSDDLKFLDDDVENNICEVDRGNRLTQIQLEKTECCGFGYFPIIFLLIGLLLLGIILIVIGIEI